MIDNRPGFNPQRLVILMQDAIHRCELQLNGAVVLTEAATGAYVVTPVLAAMAGAERVFAIAHDSCYGTVEQVEEQTMLLAKLASVSERIEIIVHKSKKLIEQADIITNSGHVRPIDAQMVTWMKPTAVISLMYEAWEFRPDDINLKACHDKGITVVGVNERHPSVDVFSFLGIMATKLLLDAGIAVYKSNILLLCDNPFNSFIEQGLIKVGADVDVIDCLSKAKFHNFYDAILVALKPTNNTVLSITDITLITKHWQGIVVAQFWGDIDRIAIANAGLSIWPANSPTSGHMGILPSDIGPEPVVRLQAGGLKAAMVILANQYDQLADLAQVI